MSEQALLAIVDFKRPGDWSMDDSAFEMEELVRACKAEVVGKVFCPCHPPSSATLIGKGKAAEIAALVQELGAQTVILSAELKGSQQRNLEEIVAARVIDRTSLILDIFARRARSLEGRLQVELAQLEYRLPRLVGHYDELSRLGGGIGTLGPGETKLEVDRRRISERIDRLKKELADVTRSREVKRKRRQGRRIPLVSVVGYTNAGKSTLLNVLTDAHQTTKDGLFTTLDSLSRQCALGNHQKVVFSDTVGFMHDLPHDLIEAFKATLEEVQGADLLLHVVDVSNPNYRNFKDAVDGILQELGALKKPTVLVLNKIDKLDDPDAAGRAVKRYANAVPVSALEKIGLDELLSQVECELSGLWTPVDVLLPLNRMDLVHLAHQEGDVEEVVYLAEAVRVRAHLPQHLAGRLAQSQINR